LTPALHNPVPAAWRAVDELDIKAKAAVTVVIKASDVMIAVD